MANADNLFGNTTSATEPKAKRRGRPPKSERSDDNRITVESLGVGNEADSGGNEAIGSGDAEIREEGPQAIDPATAIGGEQAPKKRGRKPGSSNKTKGAERLALDPKELAPQIQGLHVMLATLTGQPVFEISEIEAKMLAGNIANVAQHFDITATSKSMAIVGLVAVAGMIYIPRVAAIRRGRPKSVQSPVMPSMPDQVVEPPVQGRYDFSGDMGAMH